MLERCVQRACVYAAHGSSSHLFALIPRQKSPKMHWQLVHSLCEGDPHRVGTPPALGTRGGPARTSGGCVTSPPISAHMRYWIWSWRAADGADHAWDGVGSS